MILDRLENATLYSSLSHNLHKGFDFLATTDLASLTTGRHEIDGSNVFALVSEYNSKAHGECRLEAHRTYADIQYIISGRESIGYTMLSQQEVLIPYDAEKDIVFFKGETSPLVLEQGMFAVFFPQDIHRPCMQIDGVEKVKKVVIKVRI